MLETLKLAWRRVVYLAYYSDLHCARLLLAMAELIWSIALFIPGETFDRPTYSVMSSVMPELAWASLFGVMGSIQLYVLLLGNYHDRFAVWFAGINQTVWWFVVISMYISVFPPPAAISGELALAIGASWVWIRSGFGVKGRRATDD